MAASTHYFTRQYVSDPISTKYKNLANLNKTAHINDWHENVNWTLCHRQKAALCDKLSTIPMISYRKQNANRLYYTVYGPFSFLLFSRLSIMISGKKQMLVMRFNHFLHTAHRWQCAASQLNLSQCVRSHHPHTSPLWQSNFLNH